MLLVGTRSKLKRLEPLSPVRLYESDVLFVSQYNYLGVIFDTEMTLRPSYNHVKKNVYVKIFTLLKIRKCLTKHAAIMLYKHTILPYLKYAGFMVCACNIEDRRELQKCQNDALRICTNIQLRDRVRIQKPP